MHQFRRELQTPKIRATIQNFNRFAYLCSPLTLNDYAMKKQTYNTKNKLDAFERGIIKDAILKHLVEWETQLIESENNKKQISLFHPSFPMQVYREIERKLNLTEL